MNHLRPGSRIAVVGTSGSGKTYLARLLAERLGLTYISNDEIIWRAGWQSAPKADVLRAIDAATRAEGWTFDGNLGAAPEDRLVLTRCDTLIWLDLPRRVVHWEVLRRSIRRVASRERLWHDNVESWGRLLSGDSILLWSIRSYGQRRRTYRRLFEDAAPHDRVRIRLRSRRELGDWLRFL